MAEALEESRIKLTQASAEVENILEGQIDLVFSVDLKGEIVRVNPVVWQTLGYKKGELEGKSAAIVFAKEELERDMEFVKKVIGGETVQGVEVTLVTKLGKRIPFSFNSSPLKNPQGEVVGGIGVGRDLREIQKLITELKKAKAGLEVQVRERTKELQEKIEELERFNKLAVGRELKMVELKEEIKKLEKSLEEKKSSKGRLM